MEDAPKRIAFLAKPALAYRLSTKKRNTSCASIVNRPHMPGMELSLPLTLTLLTLFAALTVASGWLGAQPPDLRKENPRLIPWRFIMLLTATVTIFLIIHALTVLGLKTETQARY
ncbi:hypothetical protein ATDW_03330 [Asticcacaulis sp. DW145]|uniref:Uncharacterized protein n=2 Tax=Asticcacaulis TaxID=76890 RepID=A0ABT5IAN5_9CAUL|nr:hypothetical protein [Asticcacaulis currens]MDC7693245.1 hypothetical protein [Asticcacaulis currens]BEV09837.1 hypothetical protein ATDW_03330 [Asticcacaulis sp. DW145]